MPPQEAVFWVADASDRPASKLKPNTRFLRHIIKETKSHNEALLAKEAAEAQLRLEDLAEQEAKNRRKLRPEPGDIRRRQLGDISAILHGRKRRRPEADDAPAPKQPRRSGRGSHSRKQRSPEQHSGRRHGRQDSPTSNDLDARFREGTESDASRPLDRGIRRSRKDRQAGSPSDDRKHKDSREGRKVRGRSLSPKDGTVLRGRRSPSRGGDGGDTRLHRHKPRSSNSDKDARHRQRGSSVNPEDRCHGAELSDSDPLDDIIGPRLPSDSSGQNRGRGAKGASSGIDTRFAESYDPSTDMEPESNGDGWEEAVEAFRDRQKWKQQGASRLRDAGFSDEQIGRWERSGREKDINDVKWGKRGEGREWDRGKPASQDPVVSRRPDWARKADLSF